MRRKAVLAVVLLTLVICLTSCAEEFDPASVGWEEDWTAVGDVLAAEGAEGFVSNEVLDAMAPSGLWYATWTMGDAVVTENEDGQRSEVYDAQIYMVLEELDTEAKAQAEVLVWQNRERDSYTAGETLEGEYAGQVFTLMPLLGSTGETNPYSQGCAAFGVRGKLAICVELLAREDTELDGQALMEEFLEGLHYNDKEAE